MLSSSARTVAPASITRWYGCAGTLSRTVGSHDRTAATVGSLEAGVGASAPVPVHARAGASARQPQPTGGTLAAPGRDMSNRLRSVRPAATVPIHGQLAEGSSRANHFQQTRRGRTAISPSPAWHHLGIGSGSFARSRAACSRIRIQRVFNHHREMPRREPIAARSGRGIAPADRQAKRRGSRPPSITDSIAPEHAAASQAAARRPRRRSGDVATPSSPALGYHVGVRGPSQQLSSTERSCGREPPPA